jgi:hypothetical protein
VNRLAAVRHELLYPLQWASLFVLVAYSIAFYGLLLASAASYALTAGSSVHWIGAIAWVNRIDEAEKVIAPLTQERFRPLFDRAFAEVTAWPNKHLGLRLAPAYMALLIV